MDLDALLAQHEVPGAVVGVLDGDGAAHVSAAGTVANDTIFAVASLTKPVFATAVMSLVDAGVIELDRPLSNYLDAPYLATDARAAAITARMVLSHTTGFPNWREDGEPLYLRWDPGTRWGYAGEGFAYLHHVAERVTGRTLEQLAHDAVFAPLGMTDSFFDFRDDDEPRVARGHDPLGRMQPLTRSWGYKAAAGALFTTAADYLRLVAHSLQKNQRMFEPQARIDDELAWGLGWGIERGSSGDAVWQWGDNPGYKAFVLGYPADGRGVVVFTNSDRGAAVYREVVQELFPGAHPSLDADRRPSWQLALAPRPTELAPGRYGLVVQESWQVQGVEPGTAIASIEIDRSTPHRAAITSLEVARGFRRHGIGRRLIYGTAAYLDLRIMSASPDEESAGFFRACGFRLDEDGRQFLLTL